MKKTKILVIDDDVLITGLLDKFLKKLDFDVTTVNEPEEGWELFQKSHFDIVLSDIVMPNIDGVELLEKIKGLEPSCIVIMMTAHASLDSAIEALKLGASDYLLKPFDDLRAVQLAIERAWEHELNKRKTKKIKILQRKTANFILSMINEMRATTAKIEGYTQSAISKSLPSDEESSHKMLVQILNNQFELNRKILNLEILAQLITGELEFFKERISPTILLKQATETSSNIIKDKEVELTVEEQEGDVILKLDVDKIKEVLNNIIQNAAVHNPEGVKIEVISKSKGKKGWQFIISDNGKGIEPEDLAFFNRKGMEIDDILTKKLEGKGASLLISKLVVEKHGGEILFERPAAKGNKVTVSLPIASVQ